MAKYTVQDPDSGQTITLEGDAPPTEAELEDIFAKTKQPGFLEKAAPYVSAMARPALETAGAVGGGMLASPGGPIAAAGGGALGFAGGKAAADLLDRAMGIQKPIANAKDAAKETAGDLYTGAKAEATGLGIGAGASALKGAGKGLLSVLTGPSVEAIEARALNPEAVATAKPYETLAREFPDTLQNLSDKIGDLSDTALDKLSTSKYLEAKAPQVDLKDGVDSAWDSADKAIQKAWAQKAGVAPNNAAGIKWGDLSEIQQEQLQQASEDMGTGDQGGAFTRDSILKEVQAAGKSLGRTISDATAKAKDVLGRYSDRLAKLGPTVSQNELGNIVRDIDNDIDWGMKDQAPTNNALEDLRTRLDGKLKAANPDYAQAMEPVSEGMGMMKKAQQLFGIKRAVGEGFEPTDMTATKLKGALKETRVSSQEVLDYLKNATGRDLGQDLNHTATAEQFAGGGRSAGSRRVNAGAAVGAAAGAGLGHMIPGMGPMSGAAAGALGGAYMDENGGPIAGSLVDALVRASRAVGPIPSDSLRRAIAAAIMSRFHQGGPINGR